MAKIPVALQLYTVRDEMARDFEGTIKSVADIGYQGVELAGTFGKPAEEVRSLLDSLGLRIAGSHVPLTELESNVQAAIDYNLELENKYVVCPWLPEERRKSADDYRQLAESL